MIYIFLNTWHVVIPTEYQKNIFLNIYTCEAKGPIKYTARSASIETDTTQYLTKTLLPQLE